MALILVLVPNCSYAVEEITEQDVMETPIKEEFSFDDTTSYINDIEILGANIIKPEFILNKISLKKGDAYDKDIMQQDLKTIYR